LKAENRDGIKKVFSDQVLSYLGKRSGLTIEGNGSRLIFYRPNTLLNLKNSIYFSMRDLSFSG